MIKVIATEEYTKNGITDSELGIMPNKGYEFEVSEERYEILTKTNSKGLIFVKKVEEPKEKTEKIKKTDNKSTK